MKVIIPMAGKGTRLRPHTLTTPKPLIPIVGEPIVKRLVNDIGKVCKENIEEIAFVISPDFGSAVEEQLREIASSAGSAGTIHYQKEQLGTAHAVLCAEDAVKSDDEIIIAFADTLFIADFKLDRSADGMVWVHEVDNPSAFGVVKTDNEGYITDFIEKPQTPVSNKAIIGIYYFKEGKKLGDALQYLVDNDIREGKEYQLTDALENLQKEGYRFLPGTVKEWLDCGNKDILIQTNKRYMEYIKHRKLIHESVTVKNSAVIHPVHIEEGVELHNSVVGPYVSIGKNSVLQNSIISESIIREHASLKGMNLQNSMIGNFVDYSGEQSDISIGDYTKISE